MKTIVVSAVNIRKGGTLTILRDCLSYLSTISADYRIVAIVHKKELCDYPGIEYIEMPDTIKSWGRRLKTEYFTFNKISKQLAPVYLWLSLHDTTPRVQAEHQAVYCQTSFPFLKAKLQDLRFDPKIVLFSLFTKFAYKVNVRRNDWLIVQAQWLREGLSELLNVPTEKFIVARPQNSGTMVPKLEPSSPKMFLFPATPDCHKNFETLCEAARLLENEVGKDKFRVVLTINGSENKYSAWIKENWGSVNSIVLGGFVPREELFRLYGEATCLVFPSRVETWGLPISEYLPTGKAMLLADLPYAHETAAGARSVAFFENDSPKDLCALMRQVLDNVQLTDVENIDFSGHFADSWGEMFKKLLIF